MTNINFENGSLGDWYKATDFLLSEWDLDWLDKLKKADTKRYYYNQANQTWSKKSCTIFSAIWALSDLKNYKFSLNEIKEIDELSYTTNEFNKNAPRTRWAGWYDWFAVDLVRNYWNAKHKDLGEVVTYAVSMKDDKTIKRIADTNHNICSGYYGNATYNADYQKDCILNWTSFGASTYGHAVNYVWIWDWMWVKDNYDWTKYNVYGIANPLSKVTCLHSMWYVFVEVDNSEEIKRLEKIRTECNLTITQLWNLYNSVNDTNFQWILHYTADKIRKKIAQVEEMLSKLR